MGCRAAVTDLQYRRIACNVSQRGVGAEVGNHESVITSIGHEAAPTFFWGGKGRQGESRTPLIA